MESSRKNTRSTRLSAADMSTPMPPTRELSGRKRTRKTMGPDFIEDFFPSSGPRGAVAASSEAIKRAIRASEREKEMKDAAEALEVAEKKAKEREAVERERQENPSPEIDMPFPGFPDPIAIPGGDICQVCRQPDNGDAKEILVHCRGRGCQFEAHFSCLKNGSTTGEFDDDSSANFKCSKCKRCCICGKKKPSEAESRSVCCVGCKRLFHMRCHFPHVTDKEQSDGHWRCTNCSSGKAKEEKVDFSIRKSSRTSVKRRDDSPGQVEHSRDTKYAYAGNESRGSLSSRVPEASRNSLSDSSDRCTEEKSISGKNSSTVPLVPKKVIFKKVMKFPTKQIKRTRENSKEKARARQIARQLDMDVLASTSEGIRTPERERSLSPEINPRFKFLFEDYQNKMVEESELRQDLALWTVEQCAAYFADSLPGLAELILKHELFGSSLMIISREQFSELFPLPLGKHLQYVNAISKWRKCF
ncbi:hypothetical protein BV898_15062 [Hypsibius exemplaris]|uniref:PHD-type domain-containing protein n=1 Tax=Hypsibius exemplaris TaxID=2072580 RepID=A0A9X6N9Q8_HYPEX|nr:hypothetical protein BV898_15062 [Hypsibius exemplaris]